MQGTVEESVEGVVQFFIVAVGASGTMLVIFGMMFLAMHLFERIFHK